MCSLSLPFADPCSLLTGWVGQGTHERLGSRWQSQPAFVHTSRVMTVPATAIYFTAYDQLKIFLCGRALTSDLYAPMVAGALARSEHISKALNLPLPPSAPLQSVLAPSPNLCQPLGVGGCVNPPGLGAGARCCHEGPVTHFQLSSQPSPPPVGTVTVISPLELVRTKLQAQHVSYRELATCVQAAVAQGGWRSLWLGWGPTALRDVPFSGRHPG
jgi:hypothetical protein